MAKRALPRILRGSSGGGPQSERLNHKAWYFPGILRGYFFYPSFETQAQLGQGLVNIKLVGHGSPFCVAIGRMFLTGIDLPSAEGNMAVLTLPAYPFLCNIRMEFLLRRSFRDTLQMLLESS